MLVSLFCVVTAEERRHAANRERLSRVVGGCSRAVEFVIRGANQNCAVGVAEFWPCFTSICRCNSSTSPMSEQLETQQRC